MLQGTFDLLKAYKKASVYSLQMTGSALVGGMLGYSISSGFPLRPIIVACFIISFAISLVIIVLEPSRVMEQSTRTDERLDELEDKIDTVIEEVE